MRYTHDVKDKLPTLDLHGFKVDDVDDAIDKFIMRHNQQGSPRIRIMPGKGSGKVKEQVIKYLKLANYPWKYEPKNEGVLVVFLD